MATKQLWLNLPVKDVLKSRAFYEQLGFSFNPRYNQTDGTAQSMMVGENNFVVMLFPETTFKNFTKNEINDTLTTSQFLISIDAESREEVDALTLKAATAGATIFAEPEENQGWMYGSGFTDLDGHRWNILYMDFSKMPQ